MISKVLPDGKRRVVLVGRRLCILEPFEEVEPECIALLSQATLHRVVLLAEFFGHGQYDIVALVVVVGGYEVGRPLLLLTNLNGCIVEP